MAQFTARQLAPAIGASVAVRYEGITVECIVTDAKNSYGQVRVQVKPVAGTGAQWIELGRLVVRSEALALTSTPEEEW
jgi:hypothetical protein